MMDKDKSPNCGGNWQGCPNFKDGGCWVCGANNNGLDGATYWPGFALGSAPATAIQDLIAYGITFQKDGERVDPKDVLLTGAEIEDEATRRRHLLSEIAATDAALIDVPGREE